MGGLVKEVLEAGGQRVIASDLVSGENAFIVSGNRNGGWREIGVCRNDLHLWPS